MVLITYVQCDNVGESEFSKKLCKKEEMGIKFAYTMPSMSQQNGRVEHKFEALYNRVHAMSNRVTFLLLRSCLWVEAANTAMYWTTIQLQNPGI